MTFSESAELQKYKKLAEAFKKELLDIGICEERVAEVYDAATKDKE